MGFIFPKWSQGLHTLWLEPGILPKREGNPGISATSWSWMRSFPWPSPHPCLGGKSWFCRIRCVKPLRETWSSKVTNFWSQSCLLLKGNVKCKWNPHTAPCICYHDSQGCVNTMLPTGFEPTWSQRYQTEVHYLVNSEGWRGVKSVVKVVDVALMWWTYCNVGCVNVCSP